MSADDSTGPVEGTRARLERLLDDEIETYTALLRDAARATKRVRQKLACSACGHIERKEFTVRDFAPGLKSLELVLDRVEGRAAQQSAGGGGGETFVMVNKVMLVDADGSNTLDWLEERGLLAKPRAEVERAWTLANVTPAEHAGFIADREADAED